MKCVLEERYRRKAERLKVGQGGGDGGLFYEECILHLRCQGGEAPQRNVTDSLAAACVSWFLAWTWGALGRCHYGHPMGAILLESAFTAPLIVIMAQATGLLDSFWRVFIGLRLSSQLETAVTAADVRTEWGRTSVLEMEGLQIADFPFWGEEKAQKVIGIEQTRLRFAPLSLLPGRVRRYESVWLQGMSLVLRQEVGVLSLSFLALNVNGCGSSILDLDCDTGTDSASDHLLATANVTGTPAPLTALPADRAAALATLSSRKRLFDTQQRSRSLSPAGALTTGPTANNRRGSLNSMGSAAMRELWVLGRGFQGRFKAYAQQVDRAFGRMGDARLLWRSPQGRKNRFEVKEMVFSDVILRVEPSVWRGLVGHDVLGKEFGREFHLHARLGAAELAAADDSEGMLAREIGRLMNRQLEQQLAALLLRETLKTETLMNVVISSLARSSTAAAPTPQVSLPNGSAAANGVPAPGHGSDIGSANFAPPAALDAVPQRRRRSWLLPEAAAAAFTTTTAVAAAEKSSGGEAARKDAAGHQLAAAMDVASTAEELDPDLGQLLDVWKRTIVVSILKESRCSREQDPERLLAALGDEKELLRIARECGAQSLTRVHISTLLEALAAEPHFGGLLAEAGIDVEYLSRSLQGLTAGSILEELKANAQRLRTKAAQMRARAVRLQRDLLSDDEDEDNLLQLGQDAAEAVAGAAAAGNGGGVPKPLLEDAFNLAAVRELLEGVEDLRSGAVGRPHSRWEKALARAAARADVFLVLTVVQRFIGFLLKRLNDLPAGATQLEGKNYVCRLWNIAPRLQGDVDVHVSMMGVSLPRRNARVMTPVGPGRFQRYRARTRCFVVFLDWCLADGQSVRAYIQPSDVTLLEDCGCVGGSSSSSSSSISGGASTRSRRSFGSATGEGTPPFFSLSIEGMSLAVRELHFSAQLTSFQRMQLKTAGSAQAALEGISMVTEFDPDLPLAAQFASEGRATPQTSSSDSLSSLESTTEPRDAPLPSSAGPSVPPRGLKLAHFRLQAEHVRVTATDTLMAPLYNSMAGAFEEGIRLQVVSQLEGAARRAIGAGLTLVNRILRDNWNLVAKIGAGTELGSAAAAALLGLPKTKAATLIPLAEKRCDPAPLPARRPRSLSPVPRRDRKDVTGGSVRLRNYRFGWHKSASTGEDLAALVDAREKPPPSNSSSSSRPFPLRLNLRKLHHASEQPLGGCAASGAAAGAGADAPRSGSCPASAFRLPAMIQKQQRHTEDSSTSEPESTGSARAPFLGGASPRGRASGPGNTARRGRFFSTRPLKRPRKQQRRQTRSCSWRGGRDLEAEQQEPLAAAAAAAPAPQLQEAAPVQRSLRRWFHKK